MVPLSPERATEMRFPFDTRGGPLLWSAAMPASRGHGRTPDRVRRTMRLTLLAAVLVGVGLLLAPGAQADQIAQKRAEANQIWNELQTSGLQLESTIQRYDQARQQLSDAVHAIHQNKALLAVARANLHSAQADLSGSLVAAYKSGNPDVLAAVLSSKSISAMLDEVDLVQRANSYNASIVTRVTAYKTEVVHRQHELNLERARRAQAVQDQANRRAQIESVIAQRRATLHSVRGEIATLIQQKRAAEAAAARQRALAAQQALAAARTQQQATAEAASIGVSAGQSATPAAPATSSAAPAPAQPAVNVAAPASSVGARAASIALSKLGSPYVWGAAGPSTFDCSGLVVWAYGQLGVSLPHYTGSLWGSGTHISSSQLEPGDLVFFHGLSHVGIYVGGGNFVHAPHTGDVVRVSSLSESWYASGFDGAVRIG
jgi:peptidoglycan DL-endopeptidase CwlO